MSAREWGIHSVLATAPLSSDWHVEEPLGGWSQGEAAPGTCDCERDPGYSRHPLPGERAGTSLTLVCPSVKQRLFQEG